MRVLFAWLLLGMLCGAGGMTTTFAAGSADQDVAYRLGPEDLIKIQVWGRPDLTGDMIIDYSGTIQLPLIGTIPEDEKVYEFDLEGKPTMELPQENNAIQAAFAVFDKIIR